MTTPLEIIEGRIKRHLPTASATLDRPSLADGEWWLDVSHEGHPVTLQWSPKRNLIGVSASATGDGIGERPEETFKDVEAAAERVLQLLRGKGFTRPPTTVALRELRSLTGVTQAELAERLGVGQAAVSRFERRDDVTLQALEKYVTALGGKLEVAVVTPAGDRVVVADKPQATSSKEKRVACEDVARSLETLHEPPTSVKEHFVAASILKLWRDVAAEASASLAHTVDDVDVVFVTGDHVCSVVTKMYAKPTLNVDTQRLLHLSGMHFGSGKTGNVPEALLARFERTCRNVFAHEMWHLVDGDVSCSFVESSNEELRADAFAGYLAAKRNDEPMFGAELFHQLGCIETSCSHGAPEERACAYLRGFTRGESARLGAQWSSMLSLVVLQATSLERSRAFYAALGLELEEEKHGKGPTHYAANLGASVLELYPCADGQRTTRIGLRVKSLDESIAALRAVVPDVAVKSVVRDGARRACVLRDPDGNAVELAEAS